MTLIRFLLFGSWCFPDFGFSSSNFILRPMKYFSHLHTAIKLVEQYSGLQPFGDHAREFFRANKKYGSTDRKQILQLCYSFFRMGHLLNRATVEEKMLTGLFLCSSEPNVLLQNLQPEWNENANLPVDEKWKLITGENDDNTLLKIFPWKDELTEGIDHKQFCLSFLVQPDLFLRLRPGRENAVKNKLQEARITFKETGKDCIALPNASKLDAVLEADKEAVVQDLSSQRVGEMLRDINYGKQPVSLWDCCAGSGGKSIMAFDILQQLKITVSDLRPGILANLEDRFVAAGIKSYSAFTADLSYPKFDPGNYLPPGASFDIVMADVPCTGSGTWSRTPEQLVFFDTKEIERLSMLQKKIAGNIIPLIKPGGHLLYITCSVFKKENEEVVEFIQQRYGLKLQRMELLKGYDRKADTLFAALFSS